jgi:hypothetical protein
MKTKASQIVYAYWNEVRGTRLAPSRFEIEPSRIADVLPETFVLERSDGGAYRYRLAGTRLCEQLGVDLRGSDFLAGWESDEETVLTHQFYLMAAQGAVTRLSIELEGASGRAAEFEALILPLVHTRDTVSRFLGVMAAEEPGSTCRSREPLTARRLLAQETIWPDGRPHGLVDKLQQQVPFLPHIRNARIVRVNRRQFRVYDGGLCKPSPLKP